MSPNVINSMWDDAFWYFYDNSPGHSSCGSQPVFYFNRFFFPYNILLTEAQAQASLSQMLLRFGTMCYWFLTGRASCHRSLLNNLWGKTVCNDWWNCLWIDVPMVTGGTTGSVEEGLALTGMGVVGPFTITWPGYEHKNREYKSDWA